MGRNRAGLIYKYILVMGVGRNREGLIYKYILEKGVGRNREGLVYKYILVKGVGRKRAGLIYKYIIVKGAGRIVSKSQDSKRLSNAGIYQDNSVLNQQGNVDNYRKLKGRSL